MSTTIESLELEIQANSQSATEGIDALTQSLERLRGATKNGAGLGSVSKNLKGISSAANTLKSTSNKISEISISLKNSSVSFTDLYHKAKTGIAGLKALGQTIYSFIRESNEYIENVNLFTVSMGDYAGEAQEYAETISDAMGIDSGEWMRNQGVFMTLATGFGVVSDRAYIMSKNLTQLGYDLSSFFNMSYEESMQKLQSGLAGELEPLRRIGYDLSQAKLEATALELGIDKAVSSMTQAEKAQLRYYAIMTQVTVAHGDMARTLNAPANQMKVLKAQFNMAAREIGNIFIPALNALLPYLIAGAKIVRILANEIATLVGFEMPEVDYSGVNSMSGAAEDTSEALEESMESAKKLKSYMLGFDELNVINPNSGSDAEDTSDMFDFKLPEYNFLEGLAESRVNQIVEEMKEWLGITEDIDSWAELLDTRFGTILKTVGLIGLGIAAWQAADTLTESMRIISKLMSNPTTSIIIYATLAITGITLAFDGMEDAFENGLDKFNFGEIVGGSLLGVGAVAKLGGFLATFIDKVFSNSALNLAIYKAGINLGAKTVAGAGTAIAGGIAALIVGIPMFITGLYDALVNGIKWLSSTLIALGATLSGVGIGTIIGALGGPIGAGVGALVGLCIGLITDFTIWLWQKFDVIEEWFTNLPGLAKVAIVAVVAIWGVLTQGLGLILPGLIVGVITLIKKWDEITSWVKSKVIDPVVGFFKGLWTTVSSFFVQLWADICAIWVAVPIWFRDTIVTPISNFFSTLWSNIVSVWETVANWFNTNVVQPLVNFFVPIVRLISELFEGTWLIIRAVWFVVSTWFNETVVIPVVNFFKELWKDVSSFFVSLWKDIKLVWNKVSTWFNETVVIPVINFFKGLWTDVLKFFTQLWADICLVWAVVSAWFNESVVIPVVNFFKGLWEDTLSFFTQLWADIKVVWAVVSSWFEDTIIVPVKTAFEKACEAIGTFFANLWLGIKRGVASAMNGVIGGIESALNWIIGGFNNFLSGFDKLVQWAADVLGEDWGGMTLIQEVKFSRIAVPEYANGGFPEQGQMFIAREAGAEMVGNIGRRTAVANNDQIVSGIAGGVAEANEEQNALLREQNSLLRAILEKDSGVYLDGKNLTNSVEKYQRERGRVLVTGGVI